MHLVVMTDLPGTKNGFRYDRDNETVFGIEKIMVEEKILVLFFWTSVER